MDKPSFLKRFFGYLLLVTGLVSIIYFQQNPPVHSPNTSYLLGYYAIAAIVAFAGLFLVRKA